MPRPPRLCVPGAVYHVTGRGNDRALLFRDDADRRRFLVILDGVAARYGWHVYAYCLMGTHHHLLIRTPQADLSGGMQLLNGVYAQSFNRRYGRRGHLFQGRFFSLLVDAETHALELARYIALNPVRAGLCMRAEDWRWSSYGAVLGLVASPTFLTVGWVLEQFGAEPQQARRRLRAFVESAPDLPEQDTEQPSTPLIGV